MVSARSTAVFGVRMVGATVVTSVAGMVRPLSMVHFCFGAPLASISMLVTRIARVSVENGFMIAVLALKMPLTSALVTWACWVTRSPTAVVTALARRLASSAWVASTMPK